MKIKIVHHKLLGEGKITKQCIQLQETNIDPATLFVEFNGKIIEVSKVLIKECKKKI